MDRGGFIIGDEIRGEEIERKGKPYNPFEVSVTKAFILGSSAMFVQEPHFDIESSILGGSFELHHFM